MRLDELERDCRGTVASRDFLVLAAAALGTDKEFVMREPGFEPSDMKIRLLRSFLKRRARNEPVAYILGEREFYGLPFSVSRDTLIPRPDTETLVEEALRTIRTARGMDHLSVIDIGTGSGAIVVSIASTLRFVSPLSFYASDTSHGALRIARKNAERNGVSDRITFLRGNLLDPLVSVDIRNTTDKIILVANLPYLSEAMFEKVTDDIRRYEPHDALLADDDGLGCYIRLLGQLATLRATAWTGIPVDGSFEIDPDQCSRLKQKCLDRFPDATCDTVRDLSGRKRVFTFRYR